MTDCNLKAVSENQIANIQNFAKDRRSEMDIIAHYKLTTDAIKNIEKDSGTKADREYLDNLLRERRKYQMYVASISIMDKDFRVIGSSEQYERKGLSQLKNIDKKFHTGEFIMGNVYERVTDDGKKKLVPAYMGIYDDSSLIGYIAEELDTAYFDELRLNMDSLASGTFYVLDGDGEIITAGDTSQKESINRFVTTSKERADFQKKWDAIDHEKNPSGELRYKFGGDEFVFCSSEKKTVTEMEADMQKLLEKLRTGFADNGTQISVPCSIGVITTQAGVADYTELIRAADKAMYKAKEAGRNTFKIHEMNGEV